MCWSLLPYLDLLIRNKMEVWCIYSSRILSPKNLGVQKKNGHWNILPSLSWNSFTWHSKHELCLTTVARTVLWHRVSQGIDGDGMFGCETVLATKIVNLKLRQAIHVLWKFQNCRGGILSGNQGLWFQNARCIYQYIILVMCYSK